MENAAPKNVAEEKKGVKAWYDLIAANFDKRYEGEEGYYWDNFESRIVNELIDVAGKTVLDLGCGGGRYALSVSRTAAHATGLDISENFIKIASGKVAPGMRVDFLVGDATSLPFPDASFDAVVSLGMFEYLADPTPFLAEIRRVLKPGGEFLFICHNSGYRYSLLPFGAALRALAVRALKLGEKPAPAAEKPAGASYYGTPFEARETYWTVVRHSLAEVRGFLERNQLRLVAYRTATFGFTEDLFNLGRRAGNPALRKRLFACAVSLHRFLGLFFLTKKYGGNFIVKAVK